MTEMQLITLKRLSFPGVSEKRVGVGLPVGYLLETFGITAWRRVGRYLFALEVLRSKIRCSQGPRERWEEMGWLAF